MTHLENHILESFDDKDCQEESYEDYRGLVGSGKNKKIYKYSFF